MNIEFGLLQGLFRRPVAREIDQQAVVLTPELEQKLREHYTIYRPEDQLGYLGCSDASAIVSRKFELYFVRGHYLLDGPQGSQTVKVTHYWNEDANGIRIDCTRYQFDRSSLNSSAGYIPEEERGSYGELAIVRPEDVGYSRYKPAEGVKREILR